MRIVNGLEVYTLDEMIDKHVGLPGSPERGAFERDLKFD